MPGMSRKIASEKSAPQPPRSFEEALRELEELAARMEGGELPLEELVAAHARGAVLVGFCRDQLNAAKAKIQILERGELKDFLAEDERR